MFNSIDISTSALVAQRIRMNTCAMNMANIDTIETPEGGPYQRRSVIFHSGQNTNDRSDQGVHVARIEKQPVFRTIYDPANPYADENGYVKLPGIDQMTEMVNMMEAQRAYEANITAFEVSKSLLNTSLRLLA
ncbi:MAG: flagellar basal body rod protein FlgC [Sedimentisphaerales bacterium]|nr:flagellar basal body rod protein FlgC [Sedimentisphaerales bacterium]